MKTIKSFIVFWFFLVFSYTVLSQNKLIDCLKNELSLYPKTDSLRLNLLNELAYSYHKKDLDSSLTYLKESEAIGFTKGKAKSFYIKGLTYAIHSNYEDGLILYKEAIDNYMLLQNLDTYPTYNNLILSENININLFQIPMMHIKPFVENAILHAFDSDMDNREIEIHLKLKDEIIIYAITDNVAGIYAISEKAYMKKKDIATSITREQLFLLAKEFKVLSGVSFEDRNKYNEQGTLVSLVIPYKINAY